jgi:PAS domain S-box-containing protein
LTEQTKDSWQNNAEKLEVNYEEALAYAQGLEQEITRYRQSEADLEQRSTQLALINGITREITAIVELDKVLERTAFLVQQMFGYHHVALFLLNGNEVRLRAIAGVYRRDVPKEYSQELDEGIIGHVASYGEKVVVNDVTAEPDFVPVSPHFEAIQSQLCLPIKMAGNTLGVLDIQSPYAEAFGENDVVAMETLTNQIAIAIEKAHLYEAIQQELAERKRAEAELKTRVHQQAVVADLGLQVLAGADLATLLDGAVELVADTLAMEYCQILELLPDVDQLLLRAGVGWPAELVGQMTVSADPKFQTGYTLLSSEPVTVEAMDSETRFSGSPLVDDRGVVSGISVIIDGREWPFGVLAGHTTKRRIFTQDDINFLQAIANVLGQAIERARAEEALKESEERYRHLVESLFEAIAIYSDGRLVYVNSSGAKLLGVHAADELIGQPVADFIQPEYLDIIESYRREEESGGVPLLEDTLVRRDGTGVDVEIAGVPVTFQGRSAMQVVIRDITTRKQVEKALQENEEKYRTLIEKSSDAIFLLYGGRFEIINRKFEELFGVTEEDTNDPNFVFTNIVAPKSRRLVVEGAARLGVEERLSPRYEFTALDKDGNEIEVELTVSYPAYRRGIATQGIVRDITERKRIEEEKRRAYEQVQKYADELAEKIKEVQRQREIATILAEVVASVSLTLSTGDVLDHILLQLQQLIPYNSAAIFLVKGGDKLVMEAARGFETDVVNHEFSTKDNILFQQMKDHKSHILVQDTRQDERYQFWSGADNVRSWIGAPLLVAQRMIGYLTVDRYLAGAFNTTDANLVQAFAHQVAQTIHNAQLFADLREAQTQLIQRERLAALGQMAATVAHELRNPLMAIRMGVEYLTRDLPEDDARQRGAALMQANMDRIDRIVEDGNSIDAVGPGGEISLTLRGEENNQIITISDNGPGISEEHRQKIFEPFFTTKSRGTGLGLAIVKQIIDYHQGEIRVKSELGLGTTFTITLPHSENL